MTVLGGLIGRTTSTSSMLCINIARISSAAAAVQEVTGEYVLRTRPYLSPIRTLALLRVLSRCDEGWPSSGNAQRMSGSDISVSYLLYPK